MSIPYPVTVTAGDAIILIKKIEAITCEADSNSIVISLDSGNELTVRCTSHEQRMDIMRSIKESIVMAWRSGE